MASLPKIVGKKFHGTKLPDFTWNADLIEFDGPLVSLFRSTELDADALFVWVDCDRYKNRWCILQVLRSDLRGYLSQDISLRNLFQKAGELYLFDVGSSGKRSNFIATTLDKLPETYLPQPNSFLDVEVATPAALRLANEGTEEYDFRLNGELYLEDIAVIPKLIQQLYSFHYGLNHAYRPAVRQKLTEIMGSWRGGINAVNIFTGLKSVIPSIHRPQVTRLHYASPGYIKLDALRDLAQHIEEALLRVNDEEVYGEAEDLYRTVYKYFRAERLSGFDDQAISKATYLTPAQHQALEQFQDRFFTLLNWTTYSDSFRQLHFSPLSRMRVLLSYYRRLRRLREFVSKGKMPIGN